MTPLYFFHFFLGSLWYTYQEDNSPLVAVYFSVTTLMTIGKLCCHAFQHLKYLQVNLESDLIRFDWSITENRDDEIFFLKLLLPDRKSVV